MIEFGGKLWYQQTCAYLIRSMPYKQKTPYLCFSDATIDILNRSYSVVTVKRCDVDLMWPFIYLML